MKLERLLQAFAGQPYFDYPTVRLNFQDESDHTSRTALSRFAKRGILLELKRGPYAFSEPYRTQPHHRHAFFAVRHHDLPYKRIPR
ncbi:MAG: hypothetical protein ACPLYX_09665 [Rectinema subterraneum]|uniref:hypothetical protein n=1 Tax=Rectinema subterraneum TaxID=2653714 RepID=UPI003C7C5514